MDRIKKMIKQHEGYRGQVYLDSVGVLTCGYGHALHAGSHVSLDICELFFDQDFDAAFVLAEHFCDVFELHHLNKARFAVIIDMIYNLGFGGLSKFKRFIAAMQQSKWGPAATEMLNSKWARQVGKRAENLSVMMVEGLWFYKYKGGD